MSKGEKSRVWLKLRAVELAIFSMLFWVTFYFFMDGKALLSEDFVGHGLGYFTMALGSFYLVFLYGPISFVIWIIFFNGSRGRAKILNAAPFIVIYGASIASASYVYWSSSDTQMQMAVAATAVSFLILAVVNIIAPGMILRNAD